MFCRASAGVLFVALNGQTLYILSYRHPTNRFLHVRGYDGFVALDTFSGRLCATWTFPSLHETDKSYERCGFCACTPGLRGHWVG